MLNSAQVEVYTGVTGTVEEALKKYKKHELVSFSRHYHSRRQNRSLNNTGNSNSIRKSAF
jgi:predicted Fe-Mo cluster-binding NifX family protein